MKGNKGTHACRDLNAPRTCPILYSYTDFVIMVYPISWATSLHFAVSI